MVWFGTYIVPTVPNVQEPQLRCRFGCINLGTLRCRRPLAGLGFCDKKSISESATVLFYQAEFLGFKQYRYVQEAVRQTPSKQGMLTSA